jgi:hypothetical protein
MADTAFNTLYKQEFIAAFEQSESLVRKTVTTEAEVKANSAVFLVAGSGGASAQTRGANGLIPARADSLAQYTASLAEWNDLVRKNNYNIYAGQGDQRKIMQKSTMAVINRKIDSDIITALMTGTQYAGLVAETASLALIMRAYAILLNADVPADGNVSALITPAFFAYMMQIEEFNNVDYVNNKPFTDEPMLFRWANINWIVHPNLSGAGTATEYCLMYHKNAIGHACDKTQIDQAIGYNEEQNYSFARCSAYMGSKVLQNTGIIQIRHDGSAFAATA